MKKTILLAEDNEKVSEIVSSYLTNKGYRVICIPNGEDIILKFYENIIDIVLLDLVMPKVDGLSALENIRGNSKVPIIMFSSIDNDKIQCLCFERGISDYFIKSNLDEDHLELLCKKIEVLLKRDKNQETEDIWIYKDIKVDFKGFTATVKGMKVNLNPKEVKLLKVLLDNKGQVLSRNQLLDKVWKYNDSCGDRIIDTNIKGLRGKLDLKNEIITVRGIGYKLVL